MSAPVYIDLNGFFNNNVFPELLFDVEAIKQSIYNILSTSRGSRLFRPDYGCNLRDYLAEPLDLANKQFIKFEIIRAIEKWEPRVEIILEEFSVTDTFAGIDIILPVRIKETNRHFEFEVSLVR